MKSDKNLSSNNPENSNDQELETASGGKFGFGKKNPVGKIKSSTPAKQIDYKKVAIETGTTAGASVIGGAIIDISLDGTASNVTDYLTNQSNPTDKV